MRSNKKAKQQIHRTTQKPKQKPTKQSSNPTRLQQTIQRVSVDPQSATPQDIFALQQTVGNRAVQRMLSNNTQPTQPKSGNNSTFTPSKTPTFQVTKKSPPSVQRVTVGKYGNSSTLLRNQMIGDGEAVIAAASKAGGSDRADHAFVFMEMVTANRPMNIRIDLRLDGKTKSGKPSVSMGRMSDENLQSQLAGLHWYARKVSKTQAAKAYAKGNQLRSLMGGSLTNKRKKSGGTSNDITTSLDGSESHKYKYIKLGKGIKNWKFWKKKKKVTTIYNCATLALEILKAGGVANENSADGVFKTGWNKAPITFNTWTPKALVRGVESFHQKEIQDQEKLEQVKKKEESTQETTPSSTVSEETTSSVPETTTSNNVPTELQQTKPQVPAIVTDTIELLNMWPTPEQDPDQEHYIGEALCKGIQYGFLSDEDVKQIGKDELNLIRASVPHFFSEDSINYFTQAWMEQQKEESEEFKAQPSWNHGTCNIFKMKFY